MVAAPPALALGKPEGSADEYTDEIINNKFVTNGAKAFDKELPPPVLQDEDREQRIKRVAAVDQSCFESLVHDMNFAETVRDAGLLKNALLMEGEEATAMLRCVAIKAMPHADPRRTFVGNGVLVLSTFQGKNRLHFVMQESTAQFEAEEVWEAQESGCICCKTVSTTVAAKYGSEHVQELSFTTLPIEGNLFDVFASMQDTARLAVKFGGHSDTGGGSCCGCGSCGCSWGCWIGCCSAMCCCAGGGQQEGKWEKVNRTQADLKRILEQTTESTQDALYKFPGVSAIHDKEARELKLRRAHVIHLMYSRTDVPGLEPCEIWASPAEPAFQVAKFTAALGALTSSCPPQQDMGGGRKSQKGGLAGMAGNMGFGAASGAPSSGGRFAADSAPQHGCCWWTTYYSLCCCLCPCCCPA